MIEERNMDILYWLFQIENKNKIFYKILFEYFLVLDSINVF